VSKEERAILTPVKVLNQGQIQAIHSTSLQILKKVGVKIPHPKILNLLNKIGAKVDENTQTVRFAPELVQECIDKSTKQYTLYGRNKEKKINFGSGDKIFLSSPGQYSWVDKDGKQRRSPKLEDARDAIKMGDALENINWVGAMAVSTDIPAPIRDVVLTAELIKGTSKPCWTWVGSGKSVKFVLEIYELISGGKKQMHSFPPVQAFVEPISPLRYSKEGLEILMEFCKYGLPVCSGPMATAGSTGPITLAGNIAQENAEILSTVVIAQSINPGCAFCYGGIPHSMDPRTIGISFGSPELILMAIAMAQMARFYGFPLYVNTGLTDSKLCDTQSGLEKGIALLLGILSGADTFGHLGICGADQAASLHQLVVDNEIISYIKRLLKGFCVDEDTLALEVIERIGIGGNFLTDEHTLTYLREEIWVPQLLNRNNWDQWWSLGHNSLSEMAWEKKNYLLSTHQHPPLDYNLEREIDSIVKAAKRELL
jgi:trimethylamine--corrinoid protein Co-methyltransferase